MNKLYLPAILCLLFVIRGYGQVDTEFWFAPPDVTSGHGDWPIFLHISTLEESASVQVIQPARENNLLANVTIPGNTTHTIDLSSVISLIETNRPATVMKTGLKIVSSAPVTAYYEVGDDWNSDIFALKGKNALGGHFVIPGQNFYSNGNIYSPTPYSSFDIVATRNNTVITIKPSRPIFGHTDADVITIRLNAGETYSFRKTSLAASDNAIGTVVISNKPIAITVKDDSVFNVSCYDLLGDQLVPVEVTGTEYIVMKGFLSSNEYIFITATEDDTQIFIGTLTSPVVTLSAGEVFRQQIATEATYVRSDKKIYVCHVTGFGCELGMAVLPSIDCKGSQQIGFSPAVRASEFFGINIMVRKDGIDDFKLNGQSALIPAGEFSAVPGTNDVWYAAQLNLSGVITQNQTMLISNSRYSFQMGIIGGNANTRCRYGYFSSFSTLFIGDDFELCEGDMAELDAGLGKDSYQWSTGATTQKITVTGAGTYTVRTENEECILYDTVRVHLIEDTMDISLQAVSVDTLDESKITMTWQVEPAHLGATFLHRRTTPGSWEQVYSALPGISSFVDSGMSTDDQVYEYYASLRNICDETDVASAVHGTIRLKGSADAAKDIVSLEWTDYIGWEDGVAQYELWRKLDDAPGYKLFQSFSADQKTFSSAIATDGFNHTYVVRAIKASGNGESWSNNVTFEFSHDVFVPNVITPNSDSLNHYFEITKVEIYKHSELTIFDRWGKEVFKARNYKNDWDGGGLSTGVYYYFLDLKRNNRKLKGTISILR